MRHSPRFASSHESKAHLPQRSSTAFKYSAYHCEADVVVLDVEEFGWPPAGWPINAAHRLRVLLFVVLPLSLFQHVALRRIFLRGGGTTFKIQGSRSVITLCFTTHRPQNVEAGETREPSVEMCVCFMDYRPT